MNRISLEEVDRRLISIHGDKVKITFYAPSKEKSQFICEKGHTWYASLPSVLRGNKCPECRKQNMREKFAFTHEQIEQKIKDLGCELISGIYINAHSELEVKCDCGNIYKTNWNTLNSGQRCSVCGIAKMSEANRTSEEEIFNNLKKDNFIFIDFPDGYKNYFSLISFECEKGHITTTKLREYYKGHSCHECTKQKIKDNYSGENASNWQGGKTSLIFYMRKIIIDWKKESAKNCNYKCVITGERFEEIHHLYSFNSILSEALNNLNIPVYSLLSDYSSEQLLDIAKEVVRLHSVYPLGICLTKKIHSKFHSIYGSGDNTPEQWEEFSKSLF